MEELIMVKLIKRFNLLTISLLLFIITVSCGQSQKKAEASSMGGGIGETKASQETEIDPEKLYSEAMEQISSGETVEGMRKLAEIPFYNDAEDYLMGYSILEYFIGEWEADLSTDFDKGTTVVPYEMHFTISDNSLWFDREVNSCKRMRFPITIDYTIWKDNKTQSGTDKFEGYVLFETDEEDPEDIIIFGVEEGGIWYNFSRVADNTAKCSLSMSDEAGDSVSGSSNKFICNRITKQQDTGITWDKGLFTDTYNDTEKSDSHQYSTDNYSSGDSAVQTAKEYISYTAFSRDGLVEQLEFEGYSHFEAQRAVDSLNADWEEQALLKATDYLESTAFSYFGLVEQLEYEGFSHTEAVYGADHCGANWNEQAVKKAREYLEHSSFSKSELLDQLLFEGFTQSEAEYAVNN